MREAMHNGFQLDNRLAGLVQRVEDIREYCDVAHKIMYTQKRAGELINSARHHQVGRKKKISRSYYCEACGMWHLTSNTFFKKSTKDNHCFKKNPYKRERFDARDFFDED